MVDTNTLNWQEFGENVLVKNLARDNKRNFQFDLMKLKANARFEEHIHEDIEWVYILKGSFSDYRGTYTKGHFIINEKGSRHKVTTGTEGCIIYVCWCG